MKFDCYLFLLIDTDEDGDNKEDEEDATKDASNADAPASVEAENSYFFWAAGTIDVNFPN